MLGNSTNFGLVDVQGQRIGVTAENQMLTSQLQGEKHKQISGFPKTPVWTINKEFNYVALPKCFSSL